MSSLSKIALVSDIEIERQYFVDTIAAVDNVSYVSSINTLTSSKVINAGRIMATQNSVAIYGAIGQDSDGSLALSHLGEYGFNTKNIVSIAGYDTGQVLVLTDKEGKSAISVYLGASEMFTGKLDLEGCRYLYTATSLTLKTLYEVLERAKSQSIITFLDVPNKQKEFDLRQLENVDYLIPNRQEAGVLFNRKILTVRDAIISCKEFMKFGLTCVVITLDKDGCVVCDGSNTPIHINAPTVEVNDETGSGDIFRGVFVNNIIAGMSVVESASSAVAVASSSVGIKGVNDSITSTIKKL